MSKQASATISKASEPQLNLNSFDLAAYLQARGAIAAVIPAETNIRTPEQIIKELFALPAPDIRDLYIRAFGDNQPIELTSGASVEDFQVVIRAAYKQVFGNAHLMESERSLEAESQLCSGRISVMEFIRQLAKSEHYRKLFFDKCPNVRFIELNFKHLLGRAPENAAEISEHIKIIAEGGFEAEIDSYINSDEYFQSFGTIIVPYHRIFKTTTDNGLVGFTHLFKLLQGACSSDKSNSIDFSPTLQKSLFGNSASEVTWLSTVPESAPSVSPFEATKGDFVIPEAETSSEPTAEPTTLTIAETQDKESAAFTAWRNQFEELLDEKFVADAAVETRVIEAGRDATAGRRFNPQGFDLASYLQEQKAAESRPITEAETGAEVVSKYVNAWRDRDIVEFAQDNSVEDLDLVIEAAYKQVFGNAYIMESERIGEAESQLRSGRISVMEFVRQLAKSDHYRTLFFERCTNLRAIELNFKHLLGRAPANAAEISEHIKIIAAGGFEAEIDSYLDSDEYLQNFGTKLVPYYRGYNSHTASTLAAYTNSFSILRGACSSDKSTLGGTAPILGSSLLSNNASEITDISSVPESLARISPVGKLEFQSQDYFFPDRLEFSDINMGIPSYKSSEFLASRLESSSLNRIRLAYPIPDYNEPTKLFNGASGEDLATVINAIYKQVFGNVHLMESQRLVSAESRLMNGQLTVKEFVREVASSEIYRSLFFDSVSNIRAIELNFKHLLGRAPENAAEISEHIAIIATDGFTAEIDSYIDSKEYQTNFGDDVIPYYIGGKTQTGKTLAGYTRIFQLLKGACSSDRSLSATNLQEKPVSINFVQERPVSPEPVSAQDSVAKSLPTTKAENHIKAFAGLNQVAMNDNSIQSLEVIIRAAYRQVFGNVHLMESERSAEAESQLCDGRISVREFISRIAKSDRYRSLFFDKCSNVRFIELNFKHLLGRAPQNAEEISEHIAIIAEGGYEAEINSYIDSEEYQENFGNDVVPYYRGFTTQTGNNVAGYTHSYQLLRGASASDRSIAASSSSKLQRFILSGNPSRISPLSTVPDYAKGFNTIGRASVPTIKTVVQVVSARNETRCDRSLLAETLLQNQASNIPFIGIDDQRAPQVIEEEIIDPDTFNLVNYLQEQESAKKASEQAVQEEVVAPEFASNFTNAFADIKPLELIPGGSSVEDLDAIIANAYRQVFGNAYLMESERLLIAESKLREGTISVREFVRQLATSEHYRRSFFDKFNNLRAIELNFKHLLGRAPETHQEISKHIQLIAESGFEAEISSYIDSNEYQNAYGENIVPYYRGYQSQVGSNLVGYTNSYQLLRGASTSDKASLGGAYPRLQSNLLKDNASPINRLDIVPEYAERFNPLTVKRPVTSTEEIIAKALGLPYTKPAVEPAFPNIIESVTTQKAVSRPDTLDLITKAVGLPEPKVIDPITTYVKHSSEAVSKTSEIYQRYEALRKENPVEFLPQAISTNYVNAANGTEPVMMNDSSIAATDIVIEAAYKQVFGNVHLMESQRLTEAESQLRNREIDVAEFVGKLAKSELHRELFFNNCSNLRAVELNFKHLLGRAPQNGLEISEHITILAEQGYEAEIDSYIYSEEYQNNFGSDVVPYYRGFATQTGGNVAGYTHSYELFKGASTSDRSTAVASGARLQTSLLQDNPTQINPLSTVPAGAPSISPIKKVASTASSNGKADKATIIPFVTAAATAPSSDSANHLNAIADTQPVELRGSGAGDNLNIVIKAAYKQVFGNVHLMESQRLTEPESQLCDGSINVAEFIGKLAKSELYRELFFNNCSNVRAIELNFKHLLGRAPQNGAEISEHIAIIAEAGFDAEIDSYIYSDEYTENFGYNIVPYFRGFATQQGSNLTGYTHSYELLRGYSSSDVESNGSKIQTSLLANNPSQINPLSCFFEEVAPKVEPKATRPEDLPDYSPLYPSLEKPVGPKATSWQNQYNVIANASPVEFILGSSDQDKEIVIKALYKQVLGNAYVMESERFLVAESQLKLGDISVREFVRMLAKSELYKSRFIDNCPRYRSHELNFKHLLGRAPDSYQETLEHSNILDAQGYEADIDSYLDSNEYQAAFGENIVPYYRGYKTQTGKNLLGYTNMFKMLPNMSTSDKAGMSANSPRLAQALIYKNSGGSLPVTDINDLIRQALKPKAVATDDNAAITQLKQECEQQSREIEKLNAQLKEMEAMSGFAYAASSWQPNTSGDTSVVARTPGVCIIPGSLQEWQNRSQDLKDQVAALQGKVLERRSLNTIAESRLNKWRTRFF